MTNIIVKATKAKRRFKFALFIGKKLTKTPADKSAVISDLFPIKQDFNWNTEFELLNVAGLISGENNQREDYSVVMHFFSGSGEHLGLKIITMGDVGRKTIKFTDLLSTEFKEAKTFSVFHPTLSSNLDMSGSYLAERGYCGYEYQNLGVKGYVHGNLDAVAFVNNEIKPLGNSGIISRYYTVQHCLKGPAKYEFVFTNPTTRKIKIRPSISYAPNKWSRSASFFINSLGSYTFLVNVEDKESAYVRFKSHLYLGRPVVFRIANDSMDVFHG